MAEARRGARLVDRADPGARRLEPAVLQVVRRRQAERLLQLPRPPRRGGDRRPGRLPLARRGGRGGRGHLRRPAPRRAAARQRAARAWRRGRRRGRHLPADDPRGRGRDARLRSDRRPPQRRLRRLLPGRGQGPDAVLRGEGADHGRCRAAQGQDRRDQACGRRLPRRGAFDRDRDRGPQHRCRGGDDRGPRRLLRRGARGRGPGVPAGRARRRASALHPLQLGVDGEAEGDPAHHRRLSDRGRVDAQVRLRPQARRRRLLVLGRRRLGHRATPTSSTGRCSTAPPR